jgi:hypothetical protein
MFNCSIPWSYRRRNSACEHREHSRRSRARRSCPAFARSMRNPAQACVHGRLLQAKSLRGRARALHSIRQTAIRDPSRMRARALDRPARPSPSTRASLAAPGPPMIAQPLAHTRHVQFLAREPATAPAPSLMSLPTLTSRRPRTPTRSRPSSRARRQRWPHTSRATSARSPPSATLSWRGRWAPSAVACVDHCPRRRRLSRVTGR